MNTEYRKVHDGYSYYLQYKKHIKYLIFFNIEIWRDVPYPYYDKVLGNYLADRNNSSCNSYNTNFENFKEQYPDINMYWEYYNEELSNLIKEYKKLEDELIEKQGKIEIL